MTKVAIIIDVWLDRMLAKPKTCAQTFTPHLLLLAKITFFPISTKHFGCKNVGHLIVVWPHAECRPMVSVCVGEYLSPLRTHRGASLRAGYRLLCVGTYLGVSESPNGATYYSMLSWDGG